MFIKVHLKLINKMKIKLMYGDCLEKMNSINKKKCIIVSDQPFNIGFKYNTYNDKKTEKEYYS